MRVLLIGNPASGGGRGRKRMELVERHLRAAGCRVDARLSQHPGHAGELLADPPSDTDRVVACGGDAVEYVGPKRDEHQDTGHAQE